MRIEVKWRAIDEHTKISSPQISIVETDYFINNEDWCWSMLSENEKKILIDEIIQEEFDSQKEFEDKIDYEIDDYGL